MFQASPRAWTPVDLPKYLADAFPVVTPEKERTGLHKNYRDYDSDGGRYGKKLRRGRTEINNLVSKAFSDKMKAVWPQFLRLPALRASKAYRSYCLNYHVKGECHDGCEALHNRLPDREYAAFWNEVGPWCKQVSK